MASTACLFWFDLSGPKDMSYLNNQSGHRQPHTLIETHILLPAFGPCLFICYMSELACLDVVVL